MPSPTEKLLNLGPKSTMWLASVGIHHIEDLQRVGSVSAFRELKLRGYNVSKLMLYALEGALLGCHWNKLPPERKRDIIAEAES
jgi:DNA transformation protein and related proteins